MTLRRLAALTKQWKASPPPGVQLARIARFLGLQDAKESRPVTERELAQQASEMGVPVMNKLPDDPCLKFLDPSVPIGAGLDFEIPAEE